MIQRGIATFGLDYGKCPLWLFERMVKLGRQMIRAIVAEEGPEEFIKRIADPVWFQSLGTVLAFDWNASGLTTILTAALKEAIKGEERDLGIFICGGKGKTSRKTPDEIFNWSNKLGLQQNNANALVYNSKMAAKVDSAMIQDGFQIYHHSFFFALPKAKHPEQAKRVEGFVPRLRSEQATNVAWAVVQQGMNVGNQTARRYHWFSENIKDLVNEPHSGIASEIKLGNVLNLTAGKSEKTREISADLVSQSFNTLMKDIKLLYKYSAPACAGGPFSQMAKLDVGGEQLTLLNLETREFDTHPVINENFRQSKYLEKILWKLCDEKPENYEKLLSTEGVGPKTIRALALVSEVIYGAKPSYEDPARYSFAHGGKDATPYPVDRATYNETISKIRSYVKKL